MILALLLAAAEPQTAIDAERAFAADAQKIGQWTAFRKWATSDAIMYLPQAGSAQAWLKDKADPPVPVFWWPGRSYVSCDGNSAINTGPWVRQWGKSVGYFTTVWQRQPDGGWKWTIDHGDALKTARAEGGEIKATVAACGERAPPPAPPLAPAFVSDKLGAGTSVDGTLAWEWTVFPDGSRLFRAQLWNGKGWEVVITDQVKAQ